MLCCSIATNVLLYSSEPTYSAVELLSGVDKCTYIYERKSNKDISFTVFNTAFVCSHCIYTDINICLLLDVLTMHAFRWTVQFVQGITKVIRFTLHTKVSDNTTSFRSEKVLKDSCFYGTYSTNLQTHTRADTHFKTYFNTKISIHQSSQ